MSLSRKEVADPETRLATQVAELVERGQLSGSIRIPNTVGPLDIVVDLRARQVICSVSVDAPKEGKALTKVNWLVRQLRQAEDKVRLECHVMNQRGSGASELLGTVRQQPQSLVLDPTKTIRSFTVAVHSVMAVKSARGQGGFIDAFLGSVDSFYADVLQVLKAWAAKPPRMREQADLTELAREQETTPALVSTALSSQDGPDGTAKAEPSPESEAS